MHILKKVIEGKKKKVSKREAKEEVREVAKEPEHESEEAREILKGGKKKPIEDRKDNHARRPEARKKRGTSTGYMPR